MINNITNNVKIGGIHHITAIASSTAENLAFYEDVLDLRLVKKTVNFDDPFTYHFYFGDQKGSPGTIITFFPWENLPRGKAGAGMVAAVAFAIPSGSVDFWRKRLNGYGIETAESKRFGDALIQFEDPHGLVLELVEIQKTPEASTLNDGAITSSYRILGLHSATALQHTVDEIQDLLVSRMGMVLHAIEEDRYRFKMNNDDAFGHFYDVVIDPQVDIGRQGGGSVHHIAFRTPTDDEQKFWQQLLMDSGFSVTAVRNRKYFKSIYFHAPGGVLFEIATDPPGFAVDEPSERLGRDLKLPDRYESMRAEIESRLPKLPSHGFIHEYVKPDNREDDGQTIVALHGTGGDEHDLI
jgi:glyoxalase family protein